MKTERGTVNRVIFLAFGLALTLVVALSSPAAAKGPSVEGGRLDFRIDDLTGTPVSAEDPRFSGHVLLVDLWATWCPPCITEIPTLVELQKQYGEHGLVIVGIAFEVEEQESDRRSRLRQFVADHEINYLVLDGGPPGNLETVLPSLQNVSGLPVEILIDRNGSVAVSRNGYGYKKKWVAKLRREIETLLNAPRN